VRDWNLEACAASISIIEQDIFPVFGVQSPRIFALACLVRTGGHRDSGKICAAADFISDMKRGYQTVHRRARV